MPSSGTEAETLFDSEVPAEEPSAFRVQAVANVLAGFGWPGRGTFEKLTKPQKEVALEAARDALIRIGSHG